MKINVMKHQKTLTLLIGAFTFFTYFSVASLFYTTESEAIQVLRQSIENEDIKPLKDLLVVEKDERKYGVKAEHLKKFVSYYNTHEKQKEQLLSSLKEGKSSWLTLQKEIRYRIFDSYFIEVKPFYFNVIFKKAKNTQLFIDNEAVAVKENDNGKLLVGPVLPGAYEIKAVSYNGEIELKDEFVAEVDPNKANTDHHVNVIVANSGEEVKLLTNGYSDFTLFINGKEHLKFTDKNSYEINLGLLPVDGSVTYYIKKQFPWGLYTSKEIPIDKAVVNFRFLLKDEKKAEIEGVIEAFLLDIEKSLQTGKLDHISNSTFNFHMNFSLNHLSEILLPQDKGMKSYTLSDARLTGQINESYEVFVNAATYYEAPLFKGHREDGNKGYRYDYLIRLIYDEKQEKWLINNLHYYTR
jgi:uncharacterized membrane protein YvbJ